MSRSYYSPSLWAKFLAWKKHNFLQTTRSSIVPLQIHTYIDCSCVSSPVVRTEYKCTWPSDTLHQSCLAAILFLSVSRLFLPRLFRYSRLCASRYVNILWTTWYPLILHSPISTRVVLLWCSRVEKREEKRSQLSSRLLPYNIFPPHHFSPS